jgi:hypothetical protein
VALNVRFRPIADGRTYMGTFAMGRRPAATIILGAALLGACSRAPAHVVGPFYLDTLPDTSDVYLFRCPDGPGNGCAVDGLPGPGIVRAGGNSKYVVATQADRSDPRALHYFYFARVPQETRGWGHNPEKIVGPLTKPEFDLARQSLGLPADDIEP